jgi:tryptophan-rich sensory protein
MAIAAWLVRQSDVSRERTRATWLFLLQLGANALWTWVFFAWRAGGWALVEIAILWLLIGATVASFWRIRPKAAWLLLPYWAWVSFAAALNFTLWRLNPALL